MTAVIDSSALTFAVANDETAGALARQALAEASALVAPCLIDAEVLSAVRGLVLGGKLEVGRAESALIDLAAIDLERVPHVLLTLHAWRLRNDASAYDALYLALARLLDASLVTFDVGMADTAARHDLHYRLLRP